jgi:hypothetical protein
MRHDTHNEALDERPTLTLVEAVKDLAQTREVLEEINKHRASLNKRAEWLALIVIPEALDNAGIKTANFDGVGKVHTLADAWVTCPKDSSGDLLQWLADMGLDDVIKSTVNASTLKALVVRRLKAGEELPEFLKITPYTKAVFTKER